MNTKPIAVFGLVCLAFYGIHAFALHSGFKDAKGDTVFSKEFIRDHEFADNAVTESQSIEPFLKLLKKYKQPEEVAELELSIGLDKVYGGDCANPY